MHRSAVIILLCILFCLVSVRINAQPDTLFPSDKEASKQTIALYRNLHKLKKKGFMFGHQDDLAYGVNWRYQEGRSDVKEVTGDYPAVYGWDLSGLEQKSDNNIDGVPFKKMRQYIKEGYGRGGIITLSWHFHSPSGALKGAWDTTHGTVSSILPGGANHELFKEWLDDGAKFIASLKGTSGEAIPILFRPLHELTGSWFWWGKNECSADEFQTLYRFIVYYLQHEKKLHSLLWVYNTSDNFTTKNEFLDRYPGDDVIDMLSFDAYQYQDPTKNDFFIKNTNSLLKTICEIGEQKHKLTALGETGYEAIPYKDWWTQTLLPAIGSNKISYVLLWRNHGLTSWDNPPKMHYYVPYKGQLSQTDFINFYNLDKTLFEKEAAAENLYQ